MSKALTSIPTLLGEVSLESAAVGETKVDYRLRESTTVGKSGPN